MTPLLLTILSSSLIFVIFKLFSKFSIDTFQAIVFNYFTAFICGIFITNEPWVNTSENLESWGIYALICSTLFISLFLLMGKSAQTNGLARTSVAVKMSMAVSILSMVIYYNEPLGILKITGISMAFLGVYLVSKSDGVKKQSAGWMLFVLFIGSGILDFILNFVQNQPFAYFNSSMFTGFGFLSAGCIGFIILIIQVIRKKQSIALKNIIAGIALGVPNYFSIYMLIESYSSTTLEDSTVISIANVSIVAISNIIGFSIFKEKLTSLKIIGLACSIAAISILFWAQGY